MSRVETCGTVRLIARNRLTIASKVTAKAVFVNDLPVRWRGARAGPGRRWIVLQTTRSSRDTTVAEPLGRRLECSPEGRLGASYGECRFRSHLQWARRYMLASVGERSIIHDIAVRRSLSYAYLEPYPRFTLSALEPGDNGNCRLPCAIPEHRQRCA